MKNKLPSALLPQNIVFVLALHHFTVLLRLTATAWRSAAAGKVQLLLFHFVCLVI